MKTSKTAGVVFVILSAVIFGLMPLMTKTIFAHGGNAYTAAFFRFAIGAVILGLIVKIFTHEKLLVERRKLLVILGLSTFYALMLSLLYSSYSHIDSGLATTLHFTYPAAVILLQLLLFRMKPKVRELICLALAVAGVFLMNFRGGEAGPLGIVLAVGSGVAYAFYIALYGHSIVKDLSPLVLSFWISVFAAAELAVFITVTGNWSFPADALGWGMTAVLAVSADVLALVLFQAGLRSVGGVAASLLSTFEPVTGLLVGVIVFREALTVLSVIAVALILASVVILLAKKESNN